MKRKSIWILAAALMLLVMGCDNEPEPVAVESVTLDEATLTLKSGETRKLTATVKPDNADDKTVVWYLSLDAPVTVDGDGMVTALRRGTGTITAATGFSQDDKTATCEVTVVVPTMEGGVIDDYGALSKYTGKETVVVIPDDVTGIEDEAFNWCTSITKVTIPDSVQYIGRKAFYWCTNLKSVTIGNGVTDINVSAFERCTSLESVTLPDSVTSIKDDAFAFCESLESVDIPASVTEIGSSAFYGCEKLTKVTYKGTLEQWCGINWGGISASPLSNSKAALYFGDTELTVADIPASVTEIKDYAFYNCKSLTSVKIPDSVTSIGSYAFRGCDGLTSMTIPAGVTGTEEDCKLSDCKNLASVTVSKGADGVWACTLRNCANLTSVTIADGVTSIGKNAFYACKKLTDVTIPDSVTSIKDDAFAFCESLESVDIPASVTEIGSAFSWCNRLTSVVIPKGVTSIEGTTFISCGKLTSVEIPDSVMKIGNWAFSGCYSLNDVTYKGTKDQWNGIEKGTDWNKDTGNYTIHCTDGDITK